MEQHVLMEQHVGQHVLIEQHVDERDLMEQTRCSTRSDAARVIGGAIFRRSKTAWCAVTAVVGQNGQPANTAEKTASHDVLQETVIYKLFSRKVAICTRTRHATATGK